ncbi:MAG: hypothetical protein P0Y56_14340 [Candidatus Andeanibacterium colombiense]|uniref:DUF4148 domain-containing protein n=1 Tax=Candidatus Andeanibacterium colombiense TaxID=3121345 RepID=A0AAJ6BM95_9SPHN|nr:MAG: hypothetical protein P0Y56_14340 [Sphingomonadaceae bacterium]
MNKFLVATASVLATATLLAVPTAPVFAAGTDGAELMQQLTTLDQRITKAQDSGALSKGDAAKFGQRIDQLEKLHAQYGIDGFSKIETRSLGQKIAELKAELAQDRI